MPTEMPASRACRSWSSAMAVLVSKPIASGTPALAPPCRILGPDLGQVEPVGDRQAGLVVRHRQADRHLAVLLLAELAAVLPRYPDRVRALLREGGVIHNPVPHRPVPRDGR